MDKLPVKWFFIIDWIEVVTVLLQMFLGFFISPQLFFGEHICPQHFGGAIDNLIEMFINDLGLDYLVAGLSANTVHKLSQRVILTWPRFLLRKFINYKVLWESSRLRHFRLETVALLVLLTIEKLCTVTANLGQLCSRGPFTWISVLSVSSSLHYTNK